MSGFGFVLGGLAEGVGAGLVERARMLKDEAMAEAEREFRGSEAQKDRNFRSEESELDRALRTDLAEKSEAGADRRNAARIGAANSRAQLQIEARREAAAAEQAWRAGETEKAREHEMRLQELQQQGGGDLMLGEGGGAYRVGGDTATPITGPDGEPFRPAAGTGFGQGDVGRDDIAKMIADEAKRLSDPDLAFARGDEPPSADEAEKIAARRVYQRLGMEPPAWARESTAPTDGEMPAPQSEAEYNALPSGTRYRHPDGQIKVKP
jgi:hypothetical protein